MAALFRIGLGLVLCLSLLGQAHRVRFWWGDAGVCPPELAQTMQSPGMWTVWSVLPTLPFEAVWGLTLLSAVFIVVGLHHRFHAALAFLGLMSIQYRCPMIHDGGDATLRFFVFYLIFLDGSRLWAIRPVAPGTPLRSGFAVRLIQLQTALIFGVAGLHKLKGPGWFTGDAMFWVAHLDDFGNRLPMAALMTAAPWLSLPMSWGTLFIELAVPLAVWVPRVRRLSVATAIAIHVALEATMYIYFFEASMVLGWMMFLRWPRGATEARPS